jgi:L,D-transpeptidase YcbB
MGSTKAGCRTAYRVLAAVLTSAAVAACGRSEPDVLPGEVLSSMLAAAVEAGSEPFVLELVSGDTVHVSPATADFYAARGREAAWVGSRELLEAGRRLHETIGRSMEDGLPPSRYHHGVAASLLAALEPEKRSDRLPDSVAVHYLAGLDVLLTEGFTRYADDLVTGTLDPAEAGIDWRIASESPRNEAILTNVLAGMDPQEIVARLRPSIAYYERMRAALAQYLAAAERGAWPQVPEETTLKPGERHDAVAVLRQRFLAGADANEAALARAGASDATLYDARLEEAVHRFQRRHAIEADGVVGGATLRELNHTVEERIAEMKLNLDRWRWLPNELGERYVIVNIAGFELEVVEGGRAIESMTVVVGRRDRPTPVFADSIQHVVTNPYWNVPDGIFRKDVLPAMQRDPYYLQRNNMEMVNGRVRQRPGPRNALGRYKFMFPNEFDVYLHDTPDGHLFSRTSRDFSSGCIRLERPADFARLLLDLQTDRGAGQLDALLASRTERWIKLDRPLPIYILYFTAWVEEDGTVRFHHDVYGRDGQLEQQVEERLEDAPGRVAAAAGAGI